MLKRDVFIWEIMRIPLVLVSSLGLSLITLFLMDLNCERELRLLVLLVRVLERELLLGFDELLLDTSSVLGVKG